MRLFERYRTDAVYNTRAVVQRTGVPADTFRAWERRYGLPSPSRTATNQRLYSDRDVAIIDWLRQQTSQGMTISQAIALLQVEDSRDASRGSNGTAKHAHAISEETPSLVTYRDRIIQALVAFDGVTADRIVEEAVALVPIDVVCRDILEAALAEIGARWQRGEAAIGAEHFASSFVMRKFASLFNASQPQHGRGPIVAACVEGELHELGLLLTSLMLSRQGYKIIYLGANMPLDELLAVIDDVYPPLVLLSATTSAAVPRLREAVQAIRDGADRLPLIMPAPMVGYGGRVFVDRPELREQIDAIYLNEDPSSLMQIVDEILSRSPVSLTH